MNNANRQNKIKNQSLISDLHSLRHFTEEPSRFWPMFMTKIGQFFNAKQALLLVPENNNWKVLYNWQESQNSTQIELTKVLSSAHSAKKNNLNIEVDKEENTLIFSGFISFKNGQDSAVISLSLSLDSSPDNETLVNYFQLLCGIPDDYLKQLKIIKSGVDNKTAYEVLELLTLLQSSQSYQQSIITLCNEISSRYQFKSVSLGWLEKGYIRLQAISHSEKLNRKMMHCRCIESAMEEAQDQELLYPSDSTQIQHNHAEMAKQNGTKSIASIPLRYQGEVVAVLSAEKLEQTISREELMRLRILCDQVIDKLYPLKQKSRGLIRRGLGAIRQKTRKILGVEHTLAKLVIISLSLVLLYMSLATWPYRIEAPFVLKADNTYFITTPFDAYIEESSAKVGDKVTQDQMLIQLNTDELLLQEANLLADLNRAKREAEKYRATQALADMKIATTRQQQAEIRLQQVQQDLRKASIQSPRQGIVVEGDLSRLLGAPVKKGDILLKISSLDQLSVELELDEIYIHEMHNQLEGEITFQSQPNQSFPIQINRINPSATVKEGKNLFILKADFSQQKQDWWHPGMSGIAKIDLGPRNILWIVTHRTSNALRLMLWR